VIGIIGDRQILISVIGTNNLIGASLPNTFLLFDHNEGMSGMPKESLTFFLFFLCPSFLLLFNLLLSQTKTHTHTPFVSFLFDPLLSKQWSVCIEYINTLKLKASGSSVSVHGRNHDVQGLS